ncbi:ABC transporter ATP-binding protein [Treponema primitia]|nr:ABC transporter ATP-binding protein [Treponema primitia]
MPFISVISNPVILNDGLYKKLFDAFRFTSNNGFIIFFGIFIILLYIFRSAYNIFYIYLLNRFSFGMFRYLIFNLFKTYITLPYKVYVQRNSTQFTEVITGEAFQVSLLLQNLIQMFSETFTVLLLYILIFLMEWRITLILTIIFGLSVFGIMTIVAKVSKQQGIKRTESYQVLYQMLSETFGNFKFIKLKGNDGGILNNVDQTAQKIARTQIISNSFGIMPRIILECFGVSCIVSLVIIIVWQYHNFDKVISLIMMYALAFYRILPAISRMLTNFNSIIYLEHPLDVVYNDIYQETEKDGNDSIIFKETIKLSGISFFYLPDKEILNNISLEIKRGEKIAITGESGSGKSTLADIIIGINKPLTGTLYIDDIPVTEKNIRMWRNKIGYIPQSIYLIDNTVAENVAFGTEIDEKKMIHVLQMANIWDFLLTKEGINTQVGEAGIQLSGGQKQRIGIARALYNDPEVLVLDEATSSLDNETEAKIMDEIYEVSNKKTLTLIVIAHRLSTVNLCDRVIKINNGKIV